MTQPSFHVFPGAPDSPVILHVPHGARTVPPVARPRILLDDAALEGESDRITDAHTLRIAARAARRAPAAPWRLVNRLSRLVVDPERFPDEREEMRAVGMGAVYTRTTLRGVLRDERAPGFAAHEAELLNAFFTPYAAAMTALVEDRLAACGRAVVLDVHSYPARALPYELHGDGARPRVCLGTDAFHTPPALLDAARTVFEARLGPGTTALDTPFAGCYVPLRHYGRDARVSALMLELRRDADADGVHLLADALAELTDLAGAVGPAGTA